MIGAWGHYYHMPDRMGSNARASASATRLFLSKSSSSEQHQAEVEISPADHGTTPLESLVEGKFETHVIQALQKEGLTIPTPIQAHAIPLLQNGYDVMASAQTGSGKTLMFTLPLIQRLLIARQNNKRNPSAIILNPTRELAIQTATVIQQFTRGTSLRVALATGGASVGQQRRDVQTADILVATPGRILQFVDERSLVLGNSVTEVVVDEADRMLDLGFEPQLQRIARALGRGGADKGVDRRTILCSATFPREVQRVASEFLRPDYYFVAAGRVGATHEGISQKLVWNDAAPNQRRKMVVQQIQNFIKTQKKGKSRIVVFSNTKDEAERLGSALNGVAKVRVVTGDKQQSERNKSIEAFRKGDINILVATDVAARGLDVPDVGLVVQADAPRDIDSFVHRVGRTGE